ncbi:Ig-like domain-containing protein [Cellulophaga sp. L1A9]|uniref:Ig-like domain-containing protein n=1 Tax=Cellulophaga sp. L1A9 TaxID=2686362 RepID=UPI00131D4ACE|nr:Ig-like domain-containing protein [Cellulophaga sp. L1A9]
MKIPHFLKCLGFLLTFALLTLSCSQDTETTFAELIVEETIVPDEITPDEDATDGVAAEPVIDYQKGTLILSEDTKVALDITKGASENSTEKKTYSLKSITQPKNGKTEMNNNNEIIYAPAADYNGTDSFSYTMNIQDSTETTVEQVNTFEVTITPTKDVVDDLVTTTFETAKTISPLANDTFSEASDVTITEISLANKGTAVLNADNTITYTPNKDTTGEDQILYKTSVTNTDASTSTENGTLKVTIQSSEQPTGATIKYVTTTGKSTNTGATEATAWSITHAFSTAKAGDVVYIKAGNYGAVNLVVANSGTSTNKIQFIGYKTNPGDIESTNGPTVSYEDYKNNGDKLDATVMPLLQGNRTNNIGIGMGIENRKNYIEINNFQIRYFEYGIFSTGNNVDLNNIITSDHGDFYQSHSYPDYTSNAFLNLTGSGIWMTDTTNGNINNSIAINCGARGIAIVGSQNIEMNFSSVYCDNNINPTDYYIMAYKTENSNFKNCIVNRIGDLSHYGHGFSVKVNSSYNSYENCTAYGTSFELNNNIHNNTFTDCHVQGTGEALSGGWEITNYSYDNKFLRCSNDSGEGIVFSDWVESDGSNIINTAAFNNTFTDCEITNTVTHSGAIIDFHFNNQSGRLTSYAKNNTFLNCTFSGADNLFKVDRVNTGNKFINCKISNIESLRTSRYSINEELTLDVSFESCTFQNIGFQNPS